MAFDACKSLRRNYTRQSWALFAALLMALAHSQETEGAPPKVSPSLRQQQEQLFRDYQAAAADQQAQAEEAQQAITTIKARLLDIVKQYAVDAPNAINDPVSFGITQAEKRWGMPTPVTPADILLEKLRTQLGIVDEAVRSGDASELKKQVIDILSIPDLLKKAEIESLTARIRGIAATVFTDPDVWQGVIDRVAAQNFKKRVDATDQRIQDLNFRAKVIQAEVQKSVKNIGASSPLPRRTNKSSKDIQQSPPKSLYVEVNLIDFINCNEAGTRQIYRTTSGSDCSTFLGRQSQLAGKVGGDSHNPSPGLRTARNTSQQVVVNETFDGSKTPVKTLQGLAYDHQPTDVRQPLGRTALGSSETVATVSESKLVLPPGSLHTPTEPIPLQSTDKPPITSSLKPVVPLNYPASVASSPYIPLVPVLIAPPNIPLVPVPVTPPSDPPVPVTIVPPDNPPVLLSDLHVAGPSNSPNGLARTAFEGDTDASEPPGDLAVKGANTDGNGTGVSVNKAAINVQIADTDTNVQGGVAVANVPDDGTSASGSGAASASNPLSLNPSLEPIEQGDPAVKAFNLIAGDEMGLDNPRLGEMILKDPSSSSIYSSLLSDSNQTGSGAILPLSDGTLHAEPILDPDLPTKIIILNPPTSPEPDLQNPLSVSPQIALTGQSPSALQANGVLGSTNLDLKLPQNGLDMNGNYLDVHSQDGSSGSFLSLTSGAFNQLAQLMSLTSRARQTSPSAAPCGNSSAYAENGIARPNSSPTVSTGIPAGYSSGLTFAQANAKAYNAYEQAVNAAFATRTAANAACAAPFNAAFNAWISPHTPIYGAAWNNLLAVTQAEGNCEKQAGTAYDAAVSAAQRVRDAQYASNAQGTQQASRAASYTNPQIGDLQQVSLPPCPAVSNSTNQIQNASNGLSSPTAGSIAAKSGYSSQVQNKLASTQSSINPLVTSAPSSGTSLAALSNESSSTSHAHRLVASIHEEPGTSGLSVQPSAANARALTAKPLAPSLRAEVTQQLSMEATDRVSNGYRSLSAETYQAPQPRLYQVPLSGDQTRKLELYQAPANQATRRAQPETKPTEMKQGRQDIQPLLGPVNKVVHQPGNSRRTAAVVHR